MELAERMNYERSSPVLVSRHFRSIECQAAGGKGAYNSSHLRIVLPNLVEFTAPMP